MRLTETNIMTIITREVHLRSRPDGLPTTDNFEVVDRQLGSPTAGQILVQNHWMSVDPYMRGRMNSGESYIAPFEVGGPLEGAAVGVVIESGDPGFAVGDAVSHFLGWRDHSMVQSATATCLNVEAVPIQTYLGLLGLPGHAAWFGLLQIGMPQRSDTVFVSAAAGAVGSVVAQVAKIHGCRVVASVGTEAKAKWLLDEIGVDAVINYRKDLDLVAALRLAAPDGVDVYFDNVGGAHLEAAIEVANDFARFALCGMVGQYNSRPAGPPNIYAVVEKSLMLKGFVGINHLDTWPDFTRDMTRWMDEGRMKGRETVVGGLENAPSALIGLFSGDNFGKMLVELT